MKHKSYIWTAVILTLPLFLYFPLPPIRITFYVLLFILISGKMYSRFIRTKISSYRSCPATNLFYGEEGYVDIYVENGSRLPAPYLFLEDKPDFFLNYFTRQLFLFSLKGKQIQRIRYPLKGNKRGQFMLRDWRVSSTDLFGLSAWEMGFSDSKVITVFPRIFKLEKFFTTYRQPFGEIKNKYPIFEEISKPAGVRPYQSGDEQRRINWKLSARTGELLVNQYTPSISQKTMVLLNFYRNDYDFKFKEFYCELALEVAASVFNQLQEKKQDIGFATHALHKILRVHDNNVHETQSHKTLSITAAGGKKHFITLLEVLSQIHPQDQLPFSNLFEKLDNLSISSNKSTGFL